MSKSLGKTITTFLIQGSPTGLKTCFVSNKNCKALYIPRADIDKIKERKEAFYPSLYFLISADEDKKVYVGETENFYDRIKQHSAGKEFWDVVIQFYSQNNDIVKTDVKYLEHLSIEEIRSIGNVDIEENKQSTARPHLPEHQESTMNEFFEDVKFFMGFLGYDFFERIVRNKSVQTHDVNGSKKEKEVDDDLFYITRNGIDAKGFYQNGKFVVLKNSIIVKGVYNSKNKEYAENRLSYILNMKEDKIKNDFIDIGNGFIKLTKDIACNSPSQASCLCIGNNVNGWTEWRNNKGETLSDVVRGKM